MVWCVSSFFLIWRKQKKLLQIHERECWQAVRQSVGRQSTFCTLQAKDSLHSVVTDVGTAIQWHSMPVILVPGLGACTEALTISCQWRDATRPSWKKVGDSSTVPLTHNYLSSVSNYEKQSKQITFQKDHKPFAGAIINPYVPTRE